MKTIEFRFKFKRQGPIDKNPITMSFFHDHIRNVKIWPSQFSSFNFCLSQSFVDLGAIYPHDPYI